MFAVLHALGMLVGDLFKSRARLEAEILLLRHQLNLALRHAPPRIRLHGGDRAFMVWMIRLWPSLLEVVQVVQPETVLRWQRAGFRAYWRWRSRKRVGRPRIDRGLRDLIRRMSWENPLWGASRIHGELLMLGFEVAQSTVSKYMTRGRRPPSQSWKTFLYNHAHAIAAIDLCIVPTVTFERLFAFLVVGHGRRQLLWIEVTRHPTAEWLARQITEAFPWASAPACLVRDNDRAYGHVFTTRVRAMGIRDRPISPRAPWAKWHRRALDRDASPRMPGSCRCFWRVPIAPCALRFCCLLQSNAPASLTPEGCAIAASGPTDRRRHSNPNPRRTASQIRPDIIFGKDTGRKTNLYLMFQKKAPDEERVEGKSRDERTNLPPNQYL